MSIVDNYTGEFDKVINHCIDDLATLKTGRANPAILDSVTVEAYGTRTPLNQVASVSVPEARSIIIQPWDKSIIKEVEKGIRESDLGLNPVNEGDKIRIALPIMTEETRRDIVKVLHQKIEDARIAIRSVRDDVRGEITEAEKNKEFGEDEKYTLMETLEKKVGEYNEKIKRISEEKEKEIMTV